MRAARASLPSRAARRPLERLLDTVWSRAPRLAAELESAAGPLASLAAYSRHWLRKPDEWTPDPAQAATPALGELAKHLLARFPVPAYLASAWRLGEPGVRTPERDWYRHLGAGGTLREAGVPLRLTRSARRHLDAAPVHYPVRAGLRWAQARSLGASEQLAAALAGTRLGREFLGEDSWPDDIRWLAGRPAFPLARVGELVNFLFAERLEAGAVFMRGAGMVAQEPARPGLRLTGRSVAAVLTLLDRWRTAREWAAGVNRWSRSRFDEWEWAVADGPGAGLWTLRELLSAECLRREGHALRHCAARYAYRCATRRTTVWSVSRDMGGGPVRHLTLEVDPATRRLVQARGYANRAPSPVEWAVVRLWAEREGIDVPAELQPRTA